MVVQMSNQIATFVNNVVDANANVQQIIGKQTDLITKIQAQWSQNGAIAEFGFTAMFAIAIVTIVLGLIGVFFGLSPCKFLVTILHLAYLVGFVAIIIAFILSAVFIAFSLLLGDVCHLGDIVASDWTQALGSDADVLNACFRNQSLITAMNLTSYFSFADQISFPKQDLGAMLDFSSFDAFSSDIGSTTTSTFSFDSQVLGAYLNALNSATNINIGGACIITDGSYSLENIFTPWVANGDSPPNSPNPAVDYMKNRFQQFRGPCPSKTCLNGSCAYDDFIVELWQNVSTMSQHSHTCGANHICNR